MPVQKRVQRKTLTYAQMEGQGIWSDFKKWIKKHKILSRVGSAASSILPYTPLSFASLPVKLAAGAAKQAGYGYSGGRYPKQMAAMIPYRMSGMGKTPKAITRAQIHAIASGLGKWMKNGGISLAAAKYIYPTIKNLIPSQVKALAMGFGRMLKGGGVSLAGGKASGLYKKGMGYGSGIKLAGQGVPRYKKKRVYRKRVRPIYRI